MSRPIAAPDETPAARPSQAGQAAAFQGLLLLSGFCGISYEILYGRVLSNFVGDQFAVSAVVLLTFLLGIGIGTLFAHKLWRHLWLIEGGIGVCGVAIAYGARPLEAWMYAGARAGGGLAGSVLVCFAVLALPSFLIGCSLPLFAGYLGRLTSERVFARAYTVYNFGAAATAILIEFWLLRMLGVRDAILAIASLNAIVSLTLAFGFRQLRDRPVQAEPRVHIPRPTLVALTVASVASAVFQLLMIKLSECVMGPFRETFALILALVLLGIALGSALAGRWRLDFGRLMIAGLVSFVWLIGGFSWVTHTYAALYPAAVDSHILIVLLKLGLLTSVMAVPAIAFGATIPALLAQQGDVATESGRLLFVSSVANAFGFLLMAFVLHRYFDYGVLIVIIAGLMATATLAHARGRGPIAVLAVGLFAIVAGLQHYRWDENLLYLGHTSFHSTEELTAAESDMQFPERFKGYQDVFSLSKTKGNVQFFINGFVSISLNSPAEKIVGAFTSLFAPRTDNALVFGLGSGATAGTVALLFDHLDAIEINPVVVQNLYRMAPYNFDIQSRPNVNIVVDDGIHFAKVSTKQYSLIINTVTTPLYFSSAKLYTRDFFESVRQRLTPDGVYMTWIDSRVGDRGMDIIIRTLRQSFKDCWMGAIKASYFVLVCSQQPIALRQPNLIASNRVLSHYLFAQNGLRPEWLPYGLVSTRVLELAGDKTAPVNTLDYPALEFEVARLDKRGIDAFKRRLLDGMSLADVGAGLAPIGFDPFKLALHADLLLDTSTISDRWHKLIAHEHEDYDDRLTHTKLDYYGAYAAASKSAPAYRRYGATLLADGRYAEAIAQFKTALAIDPGIDNAYFDIGAAYERSGQLEAALENYARELTVDASDNEVAYREGRVAVKLKRYAQAVAWLDSAVGQRETADTQWYRGQAFEGLGQPGDARKAYERALVLDKTHEGAQQALARLR